MAFYDVFNLSNGILTKKQPGWIENFFDGITGVDLPYGYPLFNYITGNFTVTFPDIKSDSMMGETGMQQMFAFSTGLTSVSFPELTTLSDPYKKCLLQCFRECTGIQTISFPKLSYVCEDGMAECFCNCSGITGTVNFPMLRTIEKNGMYSCFDGCIGITAVYFPALIFDEETVKNTYNSPLARAFNGCTNLTEIHFRQDQQQYASYLGLQPLIDPYYVGYGTSYNPNLQILFDL